MIVNPASDAARIADPTVLTTQLVNREFAGVERELGIRQATRKEELDKVVAGFATTRAADKELLEAKLETLREKFRSQDTILSLMEEQRKERKEDDRRALDAALAAAEKARVADTEASDKANAKTELSTSEQLKLQQATANTANQGTVALLGVLQTRVERIENVKQGAQEQTVDRRAGTNQWVGIFAGAVAFASVILAGVAILVR